MDSQPQRADRRIASIAAMMRVAGEEIAVTIANASSEGLMVRCDSPPDVGAEVEVHRADVRVLGQVMWRRGRRFGLRSKRELDLDALFAEVPPTAGDLLVAKTDRARSRKVWPSRRR